MSKPLNIAIIGHQFMGRAHSNGWKQAEKFFELDATPILKVACGRNENELAKFASNWGWEEISTDWKNVINRDDIDIVDIATPTYLHHDMAIAAANNGKHIFCEKPFALNLEQAESMLKSAEEANITHYLNHNYRRCPAIRLAKNLIEDGKLGKLYHWRSTYQQDWLADPEAPMRWQLQHEYSGGGPHIDLGSHCIDLARYLIGEVSSISCIKPKFVNERPSENSNKEEVTVDDASLMSVEFKNGAVGSFECTRYASGRKNRNQFEINGSKGSVVFDLERMNELEYFSSSDAQGEQGYRKILATDPAHEYAGNWWPPGHIIGYEHTFAHASADFLNAIAHKKPIHPNFSDGVECMRILEKGSQSDRECKKILL